MSYRVAAHVQPEWRVLIHRGPLWRAITFLAGVVSVLVAIGGVVFFAIVIHSALAAWLAGNADLQWNLVLGAIVAVGFILLLVLHVRTKLRDWLLPVRTFEGVVEPIEVNLGSDGDNPSVTAFALSANAQHWMVPERVWRMVREGDLVRMRYLAGSQTVIALEAAERASPSSASPATPRA